MGGKGKRYTTSAEKRDSEKSYTLAEAIELVAGGSGTGFDETVDVAMKLNVDPRHADQNVRGTVALPHGTGRDVRVAVFAKGAKADEAREAGADFVGDDELIARVRDDGFTDFDRAVATPDMMGAVGKVARVLGPRGLMPNPKVGTVTNDVAEIVKELKAGQVEYRVDKAGIVHAVIGKASFGAEKLGDNAQQLIGSILKAKPSSAKGQYVKSVCLSSTMGPGISVDPADLSRK
ncbi:MAG TPA: 50S ribosomal protein L1 [Deltaproteobacteria bacterium]|nr:50S ribosomal protein L1 [Candidatus Binatota bacterium]HIL14398.1 50S ribosomal protein L1 [Deltaproteobacteria bacterium]